MSALVGDWIRDLERLYHPAWAAGWDAVGLVTGSPDDPAERALFAVDPTLEVLDEALAYGATLIVTHHPLLLRGVHSIAETTYKGRLLARLVREGVALYCAHTNADAADPGVSDALAARLGLTDTVPLAAAPPGDGVKVATFIPSDALDRVVDAMAQAGAGVIGDYSRCYWTAEGIGGFDAGSSANPAIGRPGQRERVPENRVEMVVPVRCVPDVVAALRAAHPYEEPAYDLLPTMLRHGRGTGRVGVLRRPQLLADFVTAVTGALPAAPVGVRYAGDGARLVERVAVCGGSGDSLIDDALKSGADVYVTADLRHHPAREAVERGLALIDAGHWATEHPWLSSAAARVTSALGASGRTVEATVSTLITDPWAACRPGGVS